MERRVVLTGLLGLGTAALVGCRSDDSEPVPRASDTSAASPTPSGPVEPKLDGIVTQGLNVPWSIVFLPSGEALVSQRDEGTIVKVSPAGKQTAIGEVSGSRGGAGGEAGLLGLALDPDDESQIYAYLTTETDNRVVRLSFDGGSFSDQQTVLDGIPRGARHQGGALQFAPDGTLFVATGEAGDPPLAQDRSSLGGKILRVTRDGKPADANPGDSPVWSWGHRNVEGLALDGEGTLWASEFGDKETDELNVIAAGKNYGWPEVEGAGGGDDFVDPVVSWPTDQCSPAGLAITRSTAFLGALRGESLWMVPLKGRKAAGEPQRLLEGKHGRLRSIAVAPDGSLWVGTSNTDGRGEVRDGDDKILRITL